MGRHLLFYIETSHRKVRNTVHLGPLSAVVDRRQYRLPAMLFEALVRN